MAGTPAKVTTHRLIPRPSGGVRVDPFEPLYLIQYQNLALKGRGAASFQDKHNQPYLPDTFSTQTRTDAGRHRQLVWSGWFDRSCTARQATSGGR